MRDVRADVSGAVIVGGDAAVLALVGDGLVAHLRDLAGIVEELARLGSVAKRGEGQ